MADPVKTLFLRAMKTAIQEIVSIKTVIRNPTKPLDREVLPFPVCFIFDEPEENQDRNRINAKSFVVHVEVWVQDPKGDEVVSDLSEQIGAEIITKMIDNPSILAYGGKMNELTSTKFFAGEDLGGIIIRFQAAYFHKRGDPTDPARG